MLGAGAQLPVQLLLGRRHDVGQPGGGRDDVLLAAGPGLGRRPRRRRILLVARVLAVRHLQVRVAKVHPTNQEAPVGPVTSD